jgi:hypothetical protein
MLDDIAVDKAGNVFVVDSMNKSIYKLSSSSILIESYAVAAGSSEDTSFLKLTVHPDSSFWVADITAGSVVRYAETGNLANEYWTPGILALCQGPNALTYVLSETDGMCRIDAYDTEGTIVDVLPAPKRDRVDVDPSLISMAADSHGNVYISHGMTPYTIWKVWADGSGMVAIGREIEEYSEDAVLVSDIAIDSESGILWSLMACKEAGLQLLDAFTLDGEFISTTGIPHSDSLYSVLSAAGDSEIYLLDNGTGPGSGELLRCSVLE